MRRILAMITATAIPAAALAATVAHYPVRVDGIGCWDLRGYIQFHRAKNKHELLADNPLTCEIASPGSREGWAWAGPCRGCIEIHGNADVVPAGSFLESHLTWYADLPDGGKAYAIGFPQQFDAGTRMVKLWITDREIHRKDGKPLPDDPHK